MFIENDLAFLRGGKGGEIFDCNGILILRDDLAFLVDGVRLLTSSCLHLLTVDAVFPNVILAFHGIQIECVKTCFLLYFPGCGILLAIREGRSSIL
jgi:hypothetical protein